MKKSAKAPPFVMVRKDLLKDETWRKLPNSTKVVYIYLRNKFNMKTLSEVTLAYSELSDMMSNQTISNAFKQLESSGFIKKTKNGGLFGGVCAYKFNGEFKDYFVGGKYKC